MTKKRFENVIDLHHVEDLKKATEMVSGIQFNSIRCSGFEQKIIRDKGFTQTVTAKPFIGLRQNNEPVLGFRIRSKSLADRLLEVLHNIMAEKNPVVDEPMFIPQVTYHNSEPDWEVRYQALARDMIEASNNLHQLAVLIERLKEEHPEFLEDDYENEN